ncbi:MAG: Flp family type IVb pilin [Elusimicrobiota bacterium]
MLINFRRNSRGQGMVEYILIVALIAVIVLVGIKLFGGKINTLFQDSAEKIESEARPQ